MSGAASSLASRQSQADRQESIAFVLAGAKVRKFCKAGRRKPHTVFMQMTVTVHTPRLCERPSPRAALQLMAR